MWIVASKKGTGDPEDRPHLPPACVVRRFAYPPSQALITGSRPRNPASQPHGRHASRLISTGNGKIGNPQGCPLESALIPARSAEPSPGRTNSLGGTVPDGV